MKYFSYGRTQSTPASAPGKDGSENAGEAVKETADGVDSFFDKLGPRLQEGWDWIQANGSDFALAVGAWIAVFLVLRIARAVIAGFIKRKKKGYYDPANVVSRLVTKTSSIFLLVVAAALVMPFFPIIPEGWGGYARTLAVIIGIIQLAAWARELLTAGIVGYADTASAQSGVLTNAINLIKTLVTIAVWSIAFLMILSNLNIEITALIAGLGVGGIAVGLAAQSIFKDLFSSFAIVFDQPFVRGDFISFDQGDYWGDVEKIGMKTTRIRSLSGEEIVIANSQLLDKEIRNYRRMDERRARITLGVLYQTPHEKLKKIPQLVEKAVENVDKARFERSHLKEYADSSINFESVFWIEDRAYMTYMDVNHEVLLNIHKAFEDEGIDFAYPTRTLHVESLPPEEPRKENGGKAG
ncbi:mechanosensitive ion channel family protein [Hyphococcus luteus]|uniref:Small-conductance mechanosensitive channel n=1 Tax=Hyphococcus luteus TaxID=2058213 RepID=A0A2S7K4K9_9PROT|nr:mechanosensitive ion channel family protein [Marinicaulis flavus]PQA87432.1 mechanosensitive ion channel protein MscS [Marinicaulis flavus]